MVRTSSPLLFFVEDILLGIVSSGRGQSSLSTAAPPALQLLSEPAGASRCVLCHRSEVEGYARSAMANSLRRAGIEPDGTVETPDTKINMYSSPTGYWQRLQSGADTSNYRIDYVIGSGNHASGYLLDVANHLFQSPVAYYKARHAYDLAPGYEGRPNPDFTRPVAQGCLFCHSGTALPIPGTSNEYQSPPFSAEAITCERCHGSVEKHINDPRAGTIVNPAKLELAARDSVCEQCHLLGAAKVLNPGKTFADFQPGQRLENTFTTYRNALPSGSDAGKFKVISHVEQLARSTCARMSRGKLWCGTCHDPHDKPLEPVQFYRAKCLSCHTEKFAPPHPSPESDCVGCHMPQRGANDGGHTAFTDHRIQRQPEPQPDLPQDTEIAAWREPVPELQKRNLGIAYINAGMERRSAPFLLNGYRLLTEVQNQFPSDGAVFTSLGNALLLGKQPAEAEIAFERALQLDPDSVTGETNAASAYLQAGDVSAAVAHLERAVALDPLHLPAVSPLVGLYKKQANEEKAVALSAKVTAAFDSQAAPVGNTQTSAGGSSKIAEEVFKNIQVLKGISSGQLIPAMRFMSASLGVQCSYCHVQDHFERDDKKPKQTARNMMRMMLAIDKNSFGGSREVTCYSCHRGSPKPDSIPIVASDALPKTGASEKLPTNLPTANEIIDHYIQALGGVDAINKITSRVGKGTTTSTGKSISVEVFDQAPGKLAVVRHMPEGDSFTAFDGQAGWILMKGRPMRDMQDADLDAARMDADLQFPLHIKKVFSELHVEYPEMIGDREAYVVSGVRQGQPPVKLYFDEQSGLLMRLVRYAESPLGLDPTQIDYSDYRDADGVQTPLRSTLSRSGERSTIQLNEVLENVVIDGANFTKPASSPAQ